MKRLNLLIITLTVFGVTNPKKITNANTEINHIEPLKTVPVQTQVSDQSYLDDLLLAAIDDGDPAEVARVLNDHKIDVNNQDHTYIPILHHAITAAGDQADQIVKLLLKAGANVNSQDMLGLTPLMLAADSRRKNTGKLAQLLISHGAKLNLKNKQGKTALQIAQNINNHVVVAEIQAAMATK